MSSKHISNTSKPSPSSMAKPVSKYRASSEEHEQFKKDFGPELIISFPGLSEPIVKPLKTADEEGK
jgi:hypothetical protein